MKNSEKTVLKYSKLRIKSMLKEIQEKAFLDLERALKSGAIAENSEFLQDNSLLALTVLEEGFKNYQIKTPQYRKEANNIQRFI